MRTNLIIIVLVVLAISAFVCYKQGVFGPKDVNVLLISMDTTRADRLSCYGYDKKTTPNIDKFAEQSVLFKSVVAHIPFTFPSHLSMMTGTIPPYHGSHDNGGKKAADSLLTLAEVLKEQGYKTGAILASYVLNARFGLNQGFDMYTEFHGTPGTTNFANGRRASETGQLTIEWLEENKDEKFFLFTHFYDAHFPYDPNAPFDVQFEDSYDGEVASVDHAIGKIIDKLKGLGLYDDTLIIVTADHGELLGQHGEAGHGYFIYEGAIKVPLLIKLPGSNKPIKVDDTVGLVDIFPTVCGYLGIEVPDFIQGMSLMPYLRGKAIKANRYQFTESLTATKFGGNSLLGVVSDRYKYIQTTRPELYDTTKDPKENDNLIEEESKRARMMQGNLKIILDSCMGGVSVDESSVDLETVKQLESLGYIGGEVDASLSFDQSKPDPKDLKYLHGWSRKASDYGILEDWENAKIWNDKVLAERPDLEVAQLMAAQIWGGSVKAESDKAKAHERIADMYFALKKYDRAIENWNKALKLGVDNADLRNKLAAANLKLKDNDEALNHYEKSLEYDPDQPEVYDAMSRIYYKRGDLAAVVEHWNKAAEFEPDNAERLNNLAWVYSSSKDAGLADPQKGLEFALRACDLTDYKESNYVDTLGVAYAANGQYAKAVETALKALDMAMSAGDENLVDEINRRLELYKSDMPYYDTGL